MLKPDREGEGARGSWIQVPLIRGFPTLQVREDGGARGEKKKPRGEKQIHQNVLYGLSSCSLQKYTVQDYNNIYPLDVFFLPTDK